MARRRPTPEPGWETAGPLAERRVVISSPRVEFSMYRLQPGYRNRLHSHRPAQLVAVVSGRGISRSVVASVRRGVATHRVESVEVAPGECFYVPSSVAHEFAAEGDQPIVILEVALSGAHPHPDATFVGRPVPRAGNRWTVADARGARRLGVAKTKEAEFAYYELPPGYHGDRHTHPWVQAGVCLSGEILHRIELSVRQGRRTYRQQTNLTIRAGDCYFIPADVPHESWVTSREPAVFLDVAFTPLGPRRPRRRRAARERAARPSRGA